ncbi:MAG: TIGR01777 family oxidoreductase [Vulcanimicrobiaceae bacterium]
MKVSIVGASGFIGKHLAAALAARGDTVVTASIRGDVRAAAEHLQGCEVVVNLAGESVAQRWTPDVKKRISDSRVVATRSLVSALAGFQSAPRRYISASAVGYYGTSLDATFTEASPVGQDFLAGVCLEWETEAYKATQAGMAVALMRTGLVLGTDGGALPQLLAPFRLGLGGVVGSGQQWYSWIHIDDMIGLYLMAIDGADGVFNATAPHPVRNRAFTEALAHALHRPAILPVPAFAMHLLFGDGATVVLDGQRVLPVRAQQAGYRFRHETIDTAFTALLG